MPFGAATVIQYHYPIELGYAALATRIYPGRWYIKCYTQTLIPYCSMAPPPRPNLTGFDIRKLAQASGMPANDPWARSLVLYRC